MTSAAIRPLPRLGRTVRRKLGALAAALGFGAVIAATPALAQADQMALTADELLFDTDQDVISAVGGVTIGYRGYTLTADRVTYYQETGRLVAAGNVRIVDPSGAVYESDYADVTDDFAEGFITNLAVATPDRTFFTAETATRTGGRITNFEVATYTACTVVESENPKPPLWQVRAQRIIHDQEEQMIYFERARLEFFGVPVAYLPYFAVPDPSVTRKTGFLFPEISYSEPLGVGITVPYFWAPAPNYDLTLNTSFFTRQGFLEDAEWRHRLAHGLYTFEAAGIFQRNGDAFGDPPGRSLRGGVRTTGTFAINRFWSFGWDGTLQSDRGFSQDYGVLNPAGTFIVDQAHVTGVQDQLYVDGHVYYFEDVRPATPTHDQARQAIVHPTIDNEYIFQRPVFGGELALRGNLTSLTRGANDPFTIAGTDYTYGVAGTTTRISEELVWRRRIIGPAGMMFEPFAFARGDAFFVDPIAPPAGFTNQAVATRGMVGAGVEWSWPWLITGPNATHIIEPVAQIIVRPSETMIGALPNDDAQSLVFDTSNVLSWNKFSGWDRVEGGTRLNLALRYVSDFGAGHFEAMIGQSYQLAGINSFAIPDLSNTGARTGLEDRVSDVVASARFDDARGHTFLASGRFNHATFAVQHASIAARGVFGDFTAQIGLAYEREYADVTGALHPGFLINGSASVKLGDHWTLSGSAAFDVISRTIVSDSIGLEYECDCATFSVRYSEARSAGSPTVNRTILFGLTLRTLTSFGVSVSP